MNPMDQAFIKAYSKEKQSGSASREVPPTVPAPHMPTTATYPAPYGVAVQPAAPQVPPQAAGPSTQWVGGQGYRVESAAPSGPWSSGTIPSAHVNFPANQAPPQYGQYAYGANTAYGPSYGEQYAPPQIPAPLQIPAPPQFVPAPQAAPPQPVAEEFEPLPIEPKPIPKAAAKPAIAPSPKVGSSWATTGDEIADIDISALAEEWLHVENTAASAPAKEALPKPEPATSHAPVEKVPAPVEPTATAINALDTAMLSEESVEDKLAARFHAAHATPPAPHFAERSRVAPATEQPTAETAPQVQIKAEAQSTAPPAPSEATKMDETPTATHEQGFDEQASPLLAVWEVDRFQWPDAAVKLHREYSYFAQAGKKLKAAAQQGLKVLGVTGLSRGEGRTLLTLCLARSAASEGVNAVLIDCDFGKPDMAGALGLDVTSGWQEASMGKISLAESAVFSVDDRLTLLPLTGDATKFSLNDRRVQAVLKEASRLFDVVLIDLGPLNEMGDDAWSTTNRPPIDAAIVVCDLRQHNLEHVREAAVKLQAAGVEAVGIAENFSMAVA